MKKTKLFTLLTSLPVLGMIATPLTSCGGNKSSIGINKIEVTTNQDNSMLLTRDHTKVMVAHTPTGKTAEFNITEGETFQNDTWANVINYANQGLAKLKEHYGISSFIGLERKVTINNKEHIVRVIGEEHDTIAGTNNKAALTFELVTLLSDSNGNKMTSKWDTTDNYEYTNSIIRANLNGTGSGTKTFSSTVLSMLPQELQDGIKTVTKKIAVTSEYTFDKYDDALFLLTSAEMAQSSCAGGPAYPYWTDHNTNNERIKKDANNNAYHYWLFSYFIRHNNYAWFVYNDGNINVEYVDYAYGVSFGFCI